MNAEMLAELSRLFAYEAFNADQRHDFDESDRLWEIADELHEKSTGRPFEDLW